MDNTAIGKLVASIKEQLSKNIASHPKLLSANLEVDDIMRQLQDQMRKQEYSWVDNKFLPNTLSVFVSEDYTSLTDDLEAIFSSHELLEQIAELARLHSLDLLLPLRSEVLEAKTKSITIAFTWPRSDDPISEADIVVNHEQRRIISIRVKKSELPVPARLTALNAEVYRNNYLLMRMVTHIGRLKNVVDPETGRFKRCNDFVFAQNDDPKAICNSVSRTHARIVFKDGKYLLEDEGSVNQTDVERRVDEKKVFLHVEPGSTIELQSGDILHFGLAQVRFQLLNDIDVNRLAKLSSEQEQASLETVPELHQQNTMRIVNPKRFLGDEYKDDE